MSLVQKMYDAHLKVLPCNRAYVGEYLDSVAFQYLDSLVQFTLPLIGETDQNDSKLVELAADFDNKLEERLLANLRDLKFNLPTVDTVTLVTGPGQIERVSCFPSDFEVYFGARLIAFELGSTRFLCSI